MTDYLLLNLMFMTAVMVILRVRRVSRYFWRICFILFVLTAVFDSLIISQQIVSYDATKLLGLYIGRAPLEDFCYSLLAVLIMSRLWQLWGKK